MKEKKMVLTVALNGTPVNPYKKWGITQNPFPQIASYEHQRYCLTLQKLGGEPIPHGSAEAYIREVLKGWDENFIKLCVDRFRPNEYVKFEVEFPE